VFTPVTCAIIAPWRVTLSARYGRIVGKEDVMLRSFAINSWVMHIRTWRRKDGAPCPGVTLLRNVVKPFIRISHGGLDLIHHRGWLFLCSPPSQREVKEDRKDGESNENDTSTKPRV
jgi:hypothetical protein